MQNGREPSESDYELMCAKMIAEVQVVWMRQFVMYFNRLHIAWTVTRQRFRALDRQGASHQMQRAQVLAVLKAEMGVRLLQAEEDFPGTWKCLFSPRDAERYALG